MKKHAVKQYDLDGELINVFPSITAAAVSIGAGNFSNISDCCRGLRDTAHGYKWAYAERDELYYRPYPCDMDCFHCQLPDCVNCSPIRTKWEAETIKAFLKE